MSWPGGVDRVRRWGEQLRILMVHNRYLYQGGEDVSTDTEVALLRDSGHEVVLLEDSNARIAEIGTVTTAVRAVWSRPARHRVDSVLAERAYDVLHVQNFFPLFSPSVFAAAGDHGVAVVQSLRNFRPMCPAASLYRAGAPCDLCIGRRVAWPGILHACYRDSRLATGAVATMSGIHSALGTFRKRVHAFVTPSAFARRKYVEAGWDPATIEVKANSVHPDPGFGAGNGGYALFAGRLEAVKGVEVLLEAWRDPTIPMPLKIVGEGPLLDTVRRLAADDPRLEVLGPQPIEEIHRLMGDAAFVVAPSLWYEVFGRVVAEAFACGTPVIVSDVGALPDLVDDGVDGFVVEPGNVADLRKTIHRMVESADRQPMRLAARAEFERSMEGRANVARLVEIYRLAMERAGTA